MASPLDHPVVSERYFFPRADEATDPRIVITKSGHSLWCARFGEGPRTVVHFHGNGEVVADWEDELPPVFERAGWSSVLVEYRGYGGSDGTPALAAMLEDGEDVVRELSLEPSRTVAFGRSIGSLYAIELAARLPLAGLILESGIHDLAERLLLRMRPDELGVSLEELHAEIERRFDATAKLRGFAGPTLLLHARDDDLIALHHAEQNAAACRRATLHVFERGGHNGIYAFNRDAYGVAVEGFLVSIGQG